MQKIIRINPLFYAILLPAIADGLLTLLGQGKTYWNNYKIINEASPAYYALYISPWVFVFGSIIWLLIWFFIFKKLKEPVNLFFLFLFIAGHSWGSSSWIMKIFREYNIYSVSNQSTVIFAWILLILYLIVLALWITYCFNVYLKIRLGHFK
jgi:hypothetical protein